LIDLAQRGGDAFGLSIIKQTLIREVRFVAPRGRGAGIILPRYNGEAMSLHLEKIAFYVALGAHAVLMLDWAG
jgi:hypothetical protein